MTDSRNICKALVLPLTSWALPMLKIQITFMFPFYTITALGEVTSHCSQDSYLQGAHPGGAVVKTQDPISCSPALPLSPGEGGRREEQATTECLCVSCSFYVSVCI